MAFRSVENDSELMPAGEYEVYVNDCCETSTKNGTDCIEFDFVIRDDIAQQYQKRHKFKRFFRDRETGSWPNDKIGRYANALGIEKGQEFELDDLIGRSAVMVTKHYTTDDGETRDCVFYLKRSDAEPYISDPQPAAYEEEDPDGELPF